MRSSDAVDAIHKALVEAYSDASNAKKNAKNPHFRSSYADLEAVLGVAKPALAENGLAIIQDACVRDGMVTLTSRIVHDSGQWIESESSAPLEKKTAQSVGSAISYLRRYSLSALLGIAQTDDDGQQASKPAPKKPKAPAVPSKERLAQSMAKAVEAGVITEEERQSCLDSLNAPDADEESRRLVTDWLKSKASNG